MALLSALVWGTGDFAGGLATRQRSQYQVVALNSLVGLVCLLIAAVWTAERLPGPVTLAWSVGAGISGVIGIAALYEGLSVAEAALIAPVAGVTGAALPVVAGTLLHGLPGPAKWIGIACGLAGIWLVAGEAGAGHGTRGLGLALLSGLGFGGFFVLIAQVEPGSVFIPLAVSKAAALLFMLLALAVRRSRFPTLSGSRLALLAGLCDAAGTVLYLLATHLIRADLAAVLSSMAPAMTVILASLICRQKVSTGQKLGVGFCLVAIALIVG